MNPKKRRARRLSDGVPLSREQKDYWKEVIRLIQEHLDRPTKIGGGWVRGKYGCWYDPKAYEEE